MLSVEVSRDGSRVVTASKDGDARIWDARTGETAVGTQRARRHGLRRVVQPERTLGRHRWPDDGGALGRATRRAHLLPAGRTEAQSARPSSPSPTRIVTRGADGVRTYDCDTCGDLEELLALAERRLAATGRELSPAERRRYLGG